MKSLPLLLFISSCSLFFGGPEAPRTAKNSLYSVNFHQAGWTQKKDKRSDYVYENSDGRIILSNSFCDEFQESSLDHLAEKTFNTVTEFKKISGKYKTFHDREAYSMEGSGKVDGVKVKLHLLNTRRDHCYFDFLAISPEGSSTVSDSTFHQFLKSVKFR